MGLPWLHLAERGTVTFVMELAWAGNRRHGKVRRLMVVSSAAPQTQDATRTEPVYAKRGSGAVTEPHCPHCRASIKVAEATGV